LNANQTVSHNGCSPLDRTRRRYRIAKNRTVLGSASPLSSGNVRADGLADVFRRGWARKIAKLYTNGASVFADDTLVDIPDDKWTW
jgi:hypothetical protein